MEAKKLSEDPAPAYQLSLRIRHPSINPVEISQALEIEPEHAFQAGDARRSGGRAPPSVHTESYWLGILKPRAVLPDISFPGNERSQVAQARLTETMRSLTWALSLSASRVLSVHAGLLRRIRAEGGQVTLLVAISESEATSFSLAPEASRLFGELGITVEFELGD